MNPGAPSSLPPAGDSWSRRFDPQASLPVRAALVVGGGAAVFAIVLSWTAGALLRGQLERQAGATLEAMAFQLSDTLDRSGYERSREVQFAASLAPLRTADTPAAERRRLLESLLDASPDFAWFGFADSDGRIVSATQGFLERTDAALRPWFAGAREQAFSGDVREVPELAREIARPGAEAPRFVAFAAPATTSDGRFLGVLAGQLNWTSARGVLATVLTDSARRERINLSVYSSAGECLLDSATSGWSAPPAAPTLPDLRRVRGYFWEDVAGDTTYLTGYARSRGFREFRGFGTVVAVRQPATQTFAPVATLRRSVLGWGLALAAVLAGASAWFAARVTRRLAAVGAAAERIRTGDVLALMPRPPGDGEVARMCEQLDAMVTDFRDKQEQLSPKDTSTGIATETVVKERDISKLI